MDLDLKGNFQKALDFLEKEESNLFITGKAGVGKSTLLSYYRNKTDKQVVVLAPTGVAALNVGGETIHSFFHFGSHITVDLAKKKGKDYRNSDMFKKIDLIIIDEISMVRADLLDSIDSFLKAALKSKKNFGGVRMVFIGDLYQLSPVLTSEERPFFEKLYDTPYFFSASSFQRADFKFIELDKIFRQKDAGFIEILNSIRNNTINEEQLFVLNQRILSNEEEGCIYLTTTNHDAEKINSDRLEKIPEGEFKFVAELEGKFDSKSVPTEMELRLKVGAQIMFLNNHKNGLWVNGTIGKVVKIADDAIVVESQGEMFEVERHKWELFKYGFDEQKRTLFQEEIGSFYQFPLRLAWAVTIHKSQGKSFDKVIIDLGRGAFAFGQCYVALSRCRSLEGIFLKKRLRKQDVRCDWKVVDFLTSWQYEISERKLSLDKKMDLIKRAIETGQSLDIVYLKVNDEKTSRQIKPIRVGEMFYENKKFIGVEAFCLKRNEQRAFRIDRILEINS